MDWPDKEVMSLLFDIAADQEIEIIDGIIHVHRDTERNGLQLVTHQTESLDALEERGWIEIQPHAPKVTDKGVYAARRYAWDVYGERVNPRLMSIFNRAFHQCATAR